MLKYIENPHFLKSLYPEGIDFNNGYISELIFSYNGPSVRITFHISHIPCSRPDKWPPNFNALSLALDFIEIDNLCFDKWGTQNRIELHIDEFEGRNFLSIKGIDCKIAFSFSWIIFQSISPYMSS